MVLDRGFEPPSTHGYSVYACPHSCIQCCAMWIEALKWTDLPSRAPTYVTYRAFVASELDVNRKVPEERMRGR